MYIVDTSVGQKTIHECPLGFILKRKSLKKYIDCYFAMEKGISLYADIGFMELPNLLVERIYIVQAEMNYSTKKSLKKDASR